MDTTQNCRIEESNYLDELEKLLPVTRPPLLSQQITSDKTSIFKLRVTHLKIRDVLRNGLKDPIVKEYVLLILTYLLASTVSI